MRKKKQEISLELILLAVSLLAMFMLFFGQFFASEMNASKDTLIPQGYLTKVIKDGDITAEEFNVLRQMTCQDIKAMLGTGKEVCIYFKDQNGNIVDPQGDGSFGVGCPGLEIEGKRICNI